MMGRRLRATLVVVTGGSHARAPEPHDDGSDGPGRGLLRRSVRRLSRPQARRSDGAWRIGTPVVILLCGALFIVSAANSDGTDLRPGRYTDLASLVKDEADQYAGLRDQVSDLDAQVQAMTASMRDRDVNRYHQRVAELKDPAGLTPRTGPGVTITLSDAPEDVINSTTGDVNLLLVHQQDIQAVVNALWRGGAEAVTVEGQRIVSTTGIKCEGNAVQLDGIPYGEPYVIVGVGELTSLTAALDADPYIQTYINDSEQADIDVGWDLTPIAAITLPAYTGLRDLHFASVLQEKPDV